MKTIKLIIALLVCSFFVQAQASVRNFYHRYHRSEDVVKFMVPGFMVKTGSLFVDDSETRHLLRRLGTVRILVAENKVNYCEAADARDFVKKLYKAHYEDLISVKDGSDRVNIMVKERKGKIRRYMIFVSSESDVVMLSGKCKLKVDDFMTLANSQKDELSKLKKG